MRIEIEDLGIVQNIEDYKLIKELDGNRILRRFESNVKFSADDYKLLLQQTVTGKGLQNVTAYEMCGEDEIAIQCNLLHNEGKFNDKSCTYTKKIFIKDPLTCIKDLEINIFDYNATSIFAYEGTIDYRSESNQRIVYVGEGVYPTVNILSGNTYTGSDGYFPSKVTITATPIIQNGVYQNHNVVENIEYFRFRNATKINEEWYPIPGSSEYYLNIPTSSLIWEAPVYTGINTNSSFAIIATFVLNNIYKPKSISNCIDFKEIIESIFSCVGLDLVSNFFGINPDDSQPNNEQYVYATTKLNNLKIAQSYDIIRESALQDSFGKSGLLKAKKFIEDLSTLFNLVLIPDTVANVLRWEHISYSNLKGIDFTTNGVEYGINEDYEVNKDLIASETWRMAARTQFGYETKIVYDVIGESQDKEYQVETILTDVLDTMNNKNYESSEYQKLFFLLQTDSEYLLRQNKDLNIQDIVKLFHYSNRALPTGKHDGLQVSFSGFSLGITNVINYEGSLKDFIKVNPTNSVKVSSGTFMITSIEFDGGQTKIKIKK